MTGRAPPAWSSRANSAPTSWCLRAKIPSRKSRDPRGPLARRLLAAAEVFGHGARAESLIPAQCLTAIASCPSAQPRPSARRLAACPRAVSDGQPWDLATAYAARPQYLASSMCCPDPFAPAWFGSDRGPAPESRIRGPTHARLRQALDAVIGEVKSSMPAAARYDVEMVFSRGLYPAGSAASRPKLAHSRFGTQRACFPRPLTRVGNNSSHLTGGPGHPAMASCSTPAARIKKRTRPHLHPTNARRSRPLRFGDGDINFMPLHVATAFETTTLHRPRVRPTFEATRSSFRRRRRDGSSRPRRRGHSRSSPACEGTLPNLNTVARSPGPKQQLTTERLPTSCPARRHAGQTRFAENSLEGDVILPLSDSTSYAAARPPNLMLNAPRPSVAS